MDLHDLRVSLNRPSAERFAVALRKRGDKARPAYIRELFTKYVGSKQVFAPPPKLRGRFVVPHEDAEWMADIIVNTHMPSSVGDTTYRAILVVVDLYTRYAWAEPMESTTDATKAMSHILTAAERQGHSAPGWLVTDADGVFQAKSFWDLMASRNIAHSFKRSFGDIAPVYRLIGTLRRSLAVEQAESGEVHWAAKARKVVAGYNQSPHAALMRGSPEEASKPEENKELEFGMQRRASEDMLHNRRDIVRRRNALQAAGAFRVLQHAPKLGRRVFRNVWSERIHMLRGFDDTESQAKDGEGKLFPTKELLPVHLESSKTALGQPQAPKSDKTRGLLRRYADKITEYLSRSPDRTAPLHKVAVMLDKTAENWRPATKLASLNQKRQMAALIEQFPDLYEIKGPNVTLL